MDRIRELQERILSLTKASRDVLDGVEGEDRNLTTDENQQFEKRNEDITKLEERIQLQRDVQEREAAMAARASDDLRGEPTGEPDSGETAEARTDREYTEIYRRFLATGETQELRALQAGASEAGGYTVPQQMAAGIIQALDDSLWMRQLGNTQTLTEGDSLGAVSLDADPEDGTWSGEIVSVDEDTAMDFGKREMETHQSAKLLKVSRKLLRVSATPIDSLVRERLAYKFGVTQEKAFLSGSGAQQPLGVFTASADGISTGRDVRISASGTTTNITADELIDVRYSLKETYVPRASWVMHRDIIKLVRKLKDSQNQYLWQPGLAGGARPGTIMDVPYRISEFAPSTVAANSYVSVLGDFSFYWIVDALDMDIQVLNELYAATNQVGYVARMETDGMPVLEEAFVRGQIAAS